MSHCMKHILFALFALLASFSAFARVSTPLPLWEGQGGESVGDVASLFTLVELNCENLFDCQHDSLKQDEAFLPQGMYQWNYGRYWNKINNIGREILACGEQKDGSFAIPDLVALCEVENDTVVRDLTQRSILRNAKYEYVITHSPDERGIDVALLYSPFTFALIDTYPIRVTPLKDMRPTRDILYVKGRTAGGDTLHVFVVHAPSRSGGEYETRANRLVVAQRLTESIDSLRASERCAAETAKAFEVAKVFESGAAIDGSAVKAGAMITGAEPMIAGAEPTIAGAEPKIIVAEPKIIVAGPKIIVAGDFNDYNGDASVGYIESCGLIDISENAPSRFGQAKGTYKFHGEWGSLDHIFLSPSLKDNVLHCEIADFPFLLCQDNSYGGLQPNRNFQGIKWHNAFSDHLPLILHLHF